jgi:hypothetical protein
VSEKDVKSLQFDIRNLVVGIFQENGKFGYPIPIDNQEDALKWNTTMRENWGKLTLDNKLGMIPVLSVSNTMGTNLELLRQFLNL